MKEIKKISDDGEEEDNEVEIINEINILMKMDHPNIVKIFGFYITKKAYYDRGKRDDVIAFVECFLKEENATRLCCHFQAPSLRTVSDKVRDRLTGKSNIYNGVIKSVEKADSFVVTTQTQENVFFWEHCALAVSCLSKGILTKNETLRMIADTQTTVNDIYSKRR